MHVKGPVASGSQSIGCKKSGIAAVPSSCLLPAAATLAVEHFRMMRGLKLFLTRVSAWHEVLVVYSFLSAGRGGSSGSHNPTPYFGLEIELAVSHVDSFNIRFSRYDSEALCVSRGGKL